MSYILKIIISCAIIIGATEVSKKLPAMGAILVALPLTSMLTMLFLYHDTKDNGKVLELAKSIPAAVIPSFIFFFCFIALAKFQLHFAWNFLLSTMVMLGCYAIYLFIMKQV